MCSEMNVNYCFGWYNSGHSVTFNGLKENQTIMKVSAWETFKTEYMHRVKSKAKAFANL